MPSTSSSLKHWASIVLIVCSMGTANAQLHTYRDSLITIKGSASFFIKNNEYFNDFTEGVTHLGFLLHPRLHVPLSHNTQIDLGMYYRQYGRDVQRATVLPSFRITHHFGDHDRILLGHIDKVHHLSEVLYREDHRWTDDLEFGLQYRHNSERWQTDLWLDWRRYTLYADPHPEEFVVGNRSKWKFASVASTDLYLEDEVLLSHSGGQISNHTSGVSNTSNISIALAMEHNLSADISASLRVAHHRSSGYHSPKRARKLKGYGTDVYARYTNKSYHMGIGYWNGSDFTSPMGEHIFLTNVDKQKSKYHKFRSILYTKLGYRTQKNRQIEAGGSGYYDLHTKTFDYNLYFYYTIQPRIRLNIKSTTWLN